MKDMGPMLHVRQIADALGITESGVRKAVDDGHFSKPVRGKLGALDVLACYAKWQRAKIAEKTNADARIKAARAEKLELGNDAMKRDLIPAEEVRRDTVRAFTELKSQLLAIDKRVEQSHGMEAGELVRKEVVSVLNLMSNYEWLKRSEK